jgi:hypothetical protein
MLMGWSRQLGQVAGAVIEAGLAMRIFEEPTSPTTRASEPWRCGNRHMACIASLPFCKGDSNCVKSLWLS